VTNKLTHVLINHMFKSEHSLLDKNKTPTHKTTLVKWHTCIWPTRSRETRSRTIYIFI